MMLPVAVLLGVSLVACGSSSSSSSTSTQTFDKSGIKVTGNYGQKPKVTHRSGSPSKSLVVKILKQGDGPVVKKGDLLTANYLGQIWRNNKVFDNSYDRGGPSSFPIGVGGVVPGWDKTLVGQKAGTRLVMSLPPADGYQKAGNSQAGIKGTDTLLFVVDIVSSANNTTMLSATPVTTKAGDITVTGALNAQPKVTVAKSGKLPTKTVLIAKGSGRLTAAGDRLISRVAIYKANGKVQSSTWLNAPKTPIDQLTVQQGSVLAGIPIGSRAILPLQGGKTFALVDVLSAVPAGTS